MKPAEILFVLALAGLALAGCQTIGNGKALEATVFDAQNGAAQGKPASSIVPGVSKKADVAREWGPASVTTFPSGYEVWVYQQTVGAPKMLNYLPVIQWFASNIEDRTTEVALLFTPDGVLRKMERRDGRAETVAGNSAPTQSVKSLSD